MKNSDKSQQTFIITTFSNVRWMGRKQHTVSFDELLTRLELYYQTTVNKNYSKTGSNTPLLFVGGEFGQSTETLCNRTLITLDLDKYNGDQESLKNDIKECFSCNSYIAYSTSSSTFANPRCRIILPLDKPILTDDYSKFANAFIDNLQNENIKNAARSEIDKLSSVVANKLMFLPFSPADNKDYDHFIMSNVGSSVSAITEKLSVDEDDFCLDYSKIPISKNDDEIRAIVFGINIFELEYQKWVEVGMALHHQYNGDEKGLILWDEWSKQDVDRYVNIADLRFRYSKFKIDKRSVTMRSLIPKKQNIENQLHGKFKPIGLNIFPDVRLNKKGEISQLKSTYENFKTMCNQYDIEISYDIIGKEIVSNLNEEDQNNFTTIMQSLLILNNMDKGNAPAYINLMGTHNKTNIFRNIIDGVVWDGKDRLTEFYNTVEVDYEYTNVRNLYLLKWIQQMLYLTLHEGKRKIARNLLIFQGCQKSGKSTWLMSLLPDTLSKYIGEGLELDLNCSTNLLKCLKKIFCELGELEQSFKKSDVNQFKAFFGRTKDELNIKYLPNPVTYNRTTSFLGTINDFSFLKDKTGSTRFLVLPVKKINGYHNIDMLQLYKQIIETVGYINFELNEEQSERQRIINEGFEQPDIIDEQFTNVFETEFTTGGTYQNCTEILEQIGYSKRDIKHNIRCDIAAVLRKYNFDYRKNIKKWNVKLISNKI